jgi:hypothetical protein
MGRVREAGLARTVEVSRVAIEWGAEEDATLRELAKHAPADTWTEVFEAHLQAMTALTAEIKELRDVNTQFLRTAARSNQETLASMSGEATTYGASGASDAPTAGAQLVDRNL